MNLPSEGGLLKKTKRRCKLWTTWMMDEIRKKRIVEATRYNIALAQLLEELKIHERKKEYFRCESCGNLVEAKVDLYNWIEKDEKIYLVCNVCRTRGF